MSSLWYMMMEMWRPLICQKNSSKFEVSLFNLGRVRTIETTKTVKKRKKIVRVTMKTVKKRKKRKKIVRMRTTKKIFS